MRRPGRHIDPATGKLLLRDPSGPRVVIPGVGPRVEATPSTAGGSVSISLAPDLGRGLVLMGLRFGASGVLIPMTPEQAEAHIAHARTAIDEIKAKARAEEADSDPLTDLVVMGEPE